jgi:hypothetical protein
MVIIIVSAIFSGPACTASFSDLYISLESGQFPDEPGTVDGQKELASFQKKEKILQRKVRKIVLPRYAHGLKLVHFSRRYFDRLGGRSDAEQ